MGQIYFKKNAKRLKKPTQKRKKRPKKWGPNETNKSNRFLYLKNGFFTSTQCYQIWQFIGIWATF